VKMKPRPRPRAAVRQPIRLAVMWICRCRRSRARLAVDAAETPRRGIGIIMTRGLASPMAGVRRAPGATEPSGQAFGTWGRRKRSARRRGRRWGARRPRDEHAFRIGTALGVDRAVAPQRPRRAVTPSTIARCVSSARDGVR
jgi:hypothetical protein